MRLHWLCSLFQVVFLSCLTIVCGSISPVLAKAPPPYSGKEEKIASCHLNLRLVSPEEIVDETSRSKYREMILEGLGPSNKLAGILKSQSHLEELRLVGFHLNENDVSELLRLQRLKGLELRGCQIQSDHWTMLKGHKSLQNIDLRHTNVKGN